MGQVALVTGANQGLGLALIKRLAADLDTDDVVYLTARNIEKGKAASWGLEGAVADVRVECLDVTEETSVAAVADTVAKRHGGLDVVISNAAARLYSNILQEEQIDVFIDTNNHGTYRMLKRFIPLLRPHGRFLVVASSFGSLLKLPQHLHQRFDVEASTLEDIETVMDTYAAAVKSGNARREGWPEWVNVASKVGQVASAKIAARMVEVDRPGDDILINAACPGLLNTDSSRPWFDVSLSPTPEDAAPDVAWLATLPPGTEAPKGELVQFRRVLPWT